MAKVQGQTELKVQGEMKVGNVAGAQNRVVTNGTTNSKYERKYRWLKKMVKDMIFVSSKNDKFDL